MSLTALDICNAALTKLGCGTIVMFGDGSSEGDVADALYEITRDALLVTHPWSFAATTSPLRRFDVPMDCSHDYGFRLPSGFVKSISVHASKPIQILGDKAYSDADSVTLEYIRRAAESEFPSHFISALVCRLAAEFCMPLTENAARSDLLFKLADAELRLARLIDSQQDELASTDDFSLIRAES